MFSMVCHYINLLVQSNRKLWQKSCVWPCLCESSVYVCSSQQIWWRHQMETFSALLALCAGNSQVTGEFPSQRPVTWRSDVFFDVHLNKRLSKQLWGWWFETPSHSLWCHCNEWLNINTSIKTKASSCMYLQIITKINIKSYGTFYCHISFQEGYINSNLCQLFDWNDCQLFERPQCIASYLLPPPLQNTRRGGRGEGQHVKQTANQRQGEPRGQGTLGQRYAHRDNLRTKSQWALRAIIIVMTLGQIHKSHNAPVPYPTL